MKKILWVSAVLVLVLAGCGGSGNSPAAGPPDVPDADAPAPMVTPFYTATPQITRTPTETPAASPTPPPLPTATPYIHIVTEGQTMIGIANYYGVSLDALGVANPDVNPSFLSVGAELVIPLETAEGEGEDLPASDPDVLPVTVGNVDCTPNRAGGMWCFWPVTNLTGEPVENLAGVVHLYDQARDLLRSKPVYSLVNLLKPGETVPLGVYFSNPPAEWMTVQGQITSAAAANQAEARYLAVSAQDVAVQPVGQDELVSQVSGEVVIPGGGPSPGIAYLWVVAVAYDETDVVVGLRRWEAAVEEISGETTGFELEVYSSGRPIDRVEILVEARAAGE